MQMGAFYISDILPEDVEELDAKDQLTEHDGPTEALSRWLDLNNVEPWQKARLMELAAPIIAKADHGMDDGHSTGAFLPISIEVKNYRSYTDAAFSFEPVHMAMVNGANGVGKSSLFMDAIADCLYEQTRKEDIGGWVRSSSPLRWGKRNTASCAPAPRLAAAHWPCNASMRKIRSGPTAPTRPCA